TRPGLPERRYGGRVYRVGDKVTQLRNNYDKNVFNGSVGVVTGLSLEEQELRPSALRRGVSRYPQHQGQCKHSHQLLAPAIIDRPHTSIVVPTDEAMLLPHTNECGCRPRPRRETLRPRHQWGEPGTALTQQRALLWSRHRRAL